MVFNPYVEKPIIAVTGSAGKTMVKTMVSAILRTRWIIFESNDYNNTTDKTKEHAEQISFIHRAAVLEYGMAYPGVITEHCRILRPNIGIITNVGLAHIGNFESKLENLAAAKSEIIHGMHPTGILIINADDPNAKLLSTQSFQGKLLKVGIKSGTDYRARHVIYTKQGMEFIVKFKGEEYTFMIPVLGRHNVINALFAIAVGNQLGFLPEELQNGLRDLKWPKHRLEDYHLKDDIMVIDDTVHAHPPAMKVALDVLEEIAKGKKIAILGSMPELGDRTDQDHEDVGRYAASKNLDFLYTYGNISVQIGHAAIEAGMSAENVKHITPLYRKVMHRELVQMIEPGTTILVKGASRLKMSDTVGFLCEYFQKDA